MISPEVQKFQFDPALNHYVEKIKNHPQIDRELSPVLASFQDRPRIVDLGCGNGHFLEEYLAENPHLVGLGIERRYKRVFKTAEKMARADTPLSRVIQMDVFHFLENSPRAFWDEVWIQFPDPWPKLRHEKHRMITHQSFQMIYDILKPGGRFCFRSDCRAYWEFLQMANLRFELYPIVKSQVGDLFKEYPQTLFQKKFLQLLIPIYSLEFRK